MQVYRQKKEAFYGFLESLKKYCQLIAPVNKDIVRFEPIESVNDIYLGKNSYFSVKEYFFKQNETIFKFTGNKIIVPQAKSEKRAFFGLRRCDLNGIMHQDSVFMKQVNDPYYSAARKDSYLLGYHCNEAPSPFCFCGSLDLAEFFDLMFYDKKDYFLVEVGSEKGKFLIEKFKSFFETTNIGISKEEKVIPGADRLEKKDISKLYDNPDWKKGVDMCLSCGACTSVCPTCYCFETHDEVTAKNPEEGERKREWSSCQVQGFTKVAGDHVFRKEREERFKHRIYHQLEYFKEKNGVNLCVGCGRCIEGCPTRIDFVNIINEMK